MVFGRGGWYGYLMNSTAHTEAGDRMERVDALQELILEAIDKHPRMFAWSLAYKLTLEQDVAAKLPDNEFPQQTAMTLDSVKQMILNKLVD